MELRLTNGATVTRVWNDSSTELLAWFQYRDHAVRFAQAKLADDASRNLWNSSYIVAQDEPLLAGRSAQLASRLQRVVEDWIGFEKQQLEAVDPTTPDLLKPRGNGGVVDNEICYDALLLVGDTDPSLSKIAIWSQEQRDRAYDWAMRAHLHASDNDDVLVPERPDYIPHVLRW